MPQLAAGVENETLNTPFLPLTFSALFLSLLPNSTPFFYNLFLLCCCYLLSLISWPFYPCKAHAQAHLGTGRKRPPSPFTGTWHPLCHTARGQRKQTPQAFSIPFWDSYALWLKATTAPGYLLACPVCSQPSPHFLKNQLFPNYSG